MTTAEIKHFGLKAGPFTKEIDDTELWLPTSKRGIVEEIVEVAQARESMGIFGDPGVGKNCLLRAVRHALSPKEFRLTYCQNATLGRRDFYRQLCQALGLTPSATAAALFHAVTQHVSELAQQRQHPVFILDEAHLLHQDTLDHLHILMNYEWDSKALLSLILVGLPELLERLALKRNRSLFTRLHHRVIIDPLTPEDTAEYLRFRLGRVGCDRELFTADAVALLHEAAQGSMRDIDRLATRALRLAARTKKKLVEKDHLIAVRQEAPS
jgi:type II secretory pathway predicted ATPase ExeA